MNERAADLLEKAARNEQVLRRFQRFEIRLLETAGLAEFLDVLLHASLGFFQLNAAELWLYDPQGILAELIPEDLRNLRGLQLFRRRRSLDRLYGKEPAVRLLSVTGADPLPVLSGRKVKSAALLPLQRQGVLVGSLHLGAADQQRFHADKSTDFVSHLARVVAVCLENAVNEDRLKRMSMFDALTQVKNRRAFHAALESEVSRAARNRNPLSLLFVDLDHFKSVNDSYGHPMGDKVLQSVAQFMQGAMRKIDHVCRYGGEEFAVILPDCSPSKAVDIAERLRAQVTRLRMMLEEDVHGPGDSISVTLSLGASCWLPAEQHGEISEAEIAQALVLSADKGVYEAKLKGRNTVCFVALAECLDAEQKA